MCPLFSTRRLQEAWRALSRLRAIPARLVLLLAITTAAFGQRNITDTNDNTITFVTAVGSLTPANSANLTSGAVQFRIRCQDSAGYRVNALATFTPGAAPTVNGGDTMGAKDVGIGIISVTRESSVITPRTDTIAAGFNYDPATVTVLDGVTPFTSAAMGRATLADLATSRTILSGPRIATSSSTSSNTNYLTVTLSLAALPQYFTPSAFSIVITLTILPGP